MKLHIVVSKAVTKEEWEKVYDETAEIVQRLSMAEVRNVQVRGVSVECLVPVKERYSMEKGKTEKKWRTSGDYKELYTGEDFSLSESMMDESTECDVSDALYGMIKERQVCRNQYVSILWGKKIYEESYFIKLLALACLIQTSLKEKVFIFGDMTIGQCRQAVRLINAYSDKPVEIPDIFEQQRLMSRIQNEPFQEVEKMRIFARMYQGEKGDEFGTYLRESFSGQVCREFWKREFAGETAGTYTFDIALYNYLSWGFDLNSLYDVIDQECNHERTAFETLIRSILETEIYKKEKKVMNTLEFDEDMQRIHSLEIQRIRFVIDSFQRNKVDRYIPLDEIRESLKNGLGRKWQIDTDSIIDQYLKEEKRKKNAHEEWEGKRGKEESYDISLYHQLLNYKCGNSIKPVIRQSLRNFFRFYRERLQEKEFADLIGQPPEEKCKWMVENNKGVLLRDQDWGKIFADIEYEKCSFARYYPLMRVKLDHPCILDMARGIVLNDELYRYCMDMADPV